MGRDGNKGAITTQVPHTARLTRRAGAMNDGTYRSLAVQTVGVDDSDNVFGGEILPGEFT